MRVRLRFVSALLEYRELWFRLTERAHCYKGSALGFGWCHARSNACCLHIRFSTVFKSRWIGMEDAGSLLFIKPIRRFNCFQYVCWLYWSSPGLVVSNKNYATKVIFPLELLVLQLLFSHVWLYEHFNTFVFETRIQRVPLTFFLLPLVWLPHFLMPYLRGLFFPGSIF